MRFAAIDFLILSLPMDVLALGLSLSKVRAAAYNTSVLVKATCECDGELFSQCTAAFKGAVFKNELQPIKGGPTALEKRATELAEPKFLAQIKAKRKLAALAVESTPPRLAAATASRQQPRPVGSSHGQH
jgi:hypothetical protein